MRLILILLFKGISCLSKFKLLIRLLESGNFSLKLEANYKVLRNEILDDYSNFTYTEFINIESITAVEPKFE